MALQSVQNAKNIGHNSINFHRRIGEPKVMDYADELGLFIYLRQNNIIIKDNKDFFIRLNIKFQN